MCFIDGPHMSEWLSSTLVRKLLPDLSDEIKKYIFMVVVIIDEFRR